MLYILKKIVNNTNAFHWTKAFNFSGHDLSSDDFMAFSNRRNLWLKERNVFEVDVDVVQPLIEHISYDSDNKRKARDGHKPLHRNSCIQTTRSTLLTSEPCCHECHHERQHVLHISGSLEQNDGEGDRHTSHPSQYRSLCQRKDRRRSRDDVTSVQTSITQRKG